MSWIFNHLDLLAKVTKIAAPSGGGGGSGANSLAWALVIFCTLLGLLVTLAASRRTTEVKRHKEE